MHAVCTPKAPRPLHAYSQAVRHGKRIEISGIVPIDPKTNVLLRGSLEEEARVVLESLMRVLEAAGSDFAHVMKVRIFLSAISQRDFNDVYAKLNTVYREYFGGQAVFPARVVVGCAYLPLGARIELEATAVVR